MAAPLDVFPPSADATPDALLAGVSGKAIEGRSLGQIAWMRLRRDKVAMGGGVVVVFLILVAIIGPHLVQSPNTYHSDLINPTFLRPNGAFGGISLAHPLGVEPETGRDVLARIVDGAQYSLLIAFLATLLAVTIGTFFGVVAGYFGGWLDSLIARAMDVFLAFPLLVFALALAGVIPNTGFGLSGNSLRIAVLIFVIGEHVALLLFGIVDFFRTGAWSVYQSIIAGILTYMLIWGRKDLARLDGWVARRVQRWQSGREPRSV